MSEQPTFSPPVVLTIAGSDSGGGAGIQTDLVTIRSNGGFGVSAITCLTAQNPREVRAIQPTDPGVFRAQLAALDDYFPIRGIKTGMLLNASIVAETACFLRKHPGTPVVVDPVLVSSSGSVLLEADAIDALKRELLPSCTILTPNLDEAAVLLGSGRIHRKEMESAALRLKDLFAPWVLLKGGHLEGAEVEDVLAGPEGFIRVFKAKKNAHVNTHGSGCTLAAALATHLALGLPEEHAVEAALAFLRRSFANPLEIAGQSFLNASPPRLAGTA